MAAGAGICRAEVPTGIKDDLKYAQRLIAQAVRKSSWSRNESWIKKYSAYVRNKCPVQVGKHGPCAVMASTTVAIAFLAHVVHQDPQAHTRVTAAKRAINMMRAFARKPPLDDNIQVSYLARGAGNAIVRTRRQSPPMLAAFIAATISEWGFSDLWWERQVALMMVTMFCSLGRGGSVIQCLRKGVSWVRKDGTQFFAHEGPPAQVCCDRPTCDNPRCVRGFLLLYPARKNHQNVPSWIPIAEKSAIRMMARQLEWLKSLPPGRYLFPARAKIRPRAPAGPIHFVPKTEYDSQMSAKTLRSLIRRALVECCGLTPTQSDRYGTHSPRNGTVEELRKCGVPSELRQQLGHWMSKQVALSYMQLNPAAQFDILSLI